LEPVALLHESEPTGIPRIEGLEEEIIAKVHAAHDGPTGSLHDLMELVDGDRLSVVQIDNQTLGIFPTPTRPACHLRVFVRSEKAESPFVVLPEAGKYHRLCGHIQADCEGLRSKEDFDEPLDKEDLHDLLQHGEQTGMMKGDAFDEQGLELVELRQGSEGFVGVKVVIQDLEDLGGLGAGQKVPFYTGGIGLTAFAAKHEQECWELMPDSEEIQGVIELMDKGLGSDLVFNSTLLSCCHFGMNLVLKGLVPILNGLDLVQIELIGLDLKLFHSRCENNKRLIVQIVQNNVNKGHDTILGLDEVNRSVFEGTEPIGEGCRVLQGRREKDQLNGGRDEDERFFPDLSPVRVVDKVAFIKDDKAQVVKA